MTFTIRRAEVADVPGIVHAHHRALTPLNDFYGAFFVMPLLEAHHIAAEAALKNDATIFLVAEHVDTKAIGGFIRYQIEAALDGQEDRQKDADPQQQPATTPAAPSAWARKEHLEDIWQGLQSRMGEMEACEKEALQGRRHAYIRHLMIDPAWQRQGLGTKLLKEVTAQCDAENMPCFIVSSAESQDLYAKVGFQELGVWTIDTGYWAKQLAERERDLGIPGNEGLTEQFAGVQEIEKCMIKLPGQV